MCNRIVVCNPKFSNTDLGIQVTKRRSVCLFSSSEPFKDTDAINIINPCFRLEESLKIFYQNIYFELEDDSNKSNTARNCITYMVEHARIQTGRCIFFKTILTPIFVRSKLKRQNRQLRIIAILWHLADLY